MYEDDMKMVERQNPESVQQNGGSWYTETGTQLPVHESLCVMVWSLICLISCQPDMITSISFTSNYYTITILKESKAILL